jgi:hypothetical protein
MFSCAAPNLGVVETDHCDVSDAVLRLPHKGLRLTRARVCTMLSVASKGAIEKT